MLQSVFGLLGNVNLSILEALYQIVRRQIDQLDSIGAIEDSIGNRFAHPNVGNLRDDVIKTFDVLNIDGGVDVDTVAHQLFDIEVAFRVAAAFGIGVGEFVDQNDLRMTRNDRVEVHLGERLAFIFDMAARNDFEPA